MARLPVVVFAVSPLFLWFLCLLVLSGFVSVWLSAAISAFWVVARISGSAPMWSWSSWVSTANATFFIFRRFRQARSFFLESPVSTSITFSGCSGERSRNASPCPTLQAANFQSCGTRFCWISGAIVVPPSVSPHVAAMRAMTLSVMRAGVCFSRVKGEIMRERIFACLPYPIFPLWRPQARRSVEIVAASRIAPAGPGSQGSCAKGMLAMVFATAATYAPNMLAV